MRVTERCGRTAGLVGVSGPLLAAAVLLVSGGAAAQSARTLEAVQLHRPDAARLARDELQACLKKKCADAGRLALLSGVLALSEGETAEAGALLQAAQPPAPLRPFPDFYAGQARFYTGDFAGAAKALRAAVDGAPPSLLLRARARLGEALLAAGDAAGAVPELDAAADALGTPELLFQRAQALATTGDVKGAREDWKSLAVRFPDHPYAATALAKLGRAALDLDDRLRRAAGLRGAGEPAAALEELRAAEKAGLVRTAEQRARVALDRAQAHYARGEVEPGDAALKKARRGPRGVAAQAALLHARRTLKTDNRAARKQMAALDVAYQREPAGEEGAFLAGWLDLQDGRFAEAGATFARYAQRYPRARRRDEATWFRAYALLRQEKPADARAVLEELLTRFPRSAIVPQARYWAARADALAGAPADVVAAGYTAVIEQFPGSYYALLASERLREAGRAPPLRFPQPPRLMPQDALPDLALVQELVQAGLFAEADDAVEAQARALRGAEQALPYAHALLRHGLWGHAHQLAARALWGAAFGSRQPEAVAAFYPRAFEPAVASEAQRAGVDPNLVWAIMRRESGFRAHVLSSADARGLMQIIPATGAAIAQKLGEPPSPPDELFAPARNIRYGAWYLAQLHQRFGHPALVAAAYNAGPTAAYRWAKERGELPLDLFVEQIPYKETRAYVKQVVGDLYLYHQLYEADGKPSPTLALKLPPAGETGVNF